MNQLEAVLAAMAHGEGRALRTAQYRHRRLVEAPLTVVLWQLGSEPFSAAALGYGQAPADLSMVVAGDPRNRDLAFAALMKFAAWFVPRFEQPSATRVEVAHGNWTEELSAGLPQILVPNRATVELIGRLGRRLAYLRTDGDQPAPPALVRLGQHLQFVGRHGDLPGQQLIVPIGQLLADHWATPQTDFERASLEALDAFVDPPAGVSGFEAAAAAELFASGPSPSGEDDTALEPLMTAFNDVRARRSDPRVVEPLLGPILDHYRSLIERSWQRTWRAVERERAYLEAPSVQRRWDEDRRQYTRHMDWTAQDGRRRTRQTARQAIDTMHRLEEAKARLIAEEALDDPVRMIPWLLDGKAVEGPVVRVEPNHTEVANIRAVRRPLVTIRSDSDRGMPAGKDLWLTTAPGGTAWQVHASAPSPDGGSLVTMKLMTGSQTVLPVLGSTICFSIHKTGWRFSTRLAGTPPWPLRAPVEPEPAPIEAVDGEDAA
jgi:hypothetical protein